MAAADEGERILLRGQIAMDLAVHINKLVLPDNRAAGKFPVLLNKFLDVRPACLFFAD